MTAPKPAAAVLDTNAVLDWLVFGDAGVQSLAGAIESGAVRWLVCPEMRDELQHVLVRPSLARWNPDCERTLHLFDRFGEMGSKPTAAVTLPACSDPDDQVFLDLAAAGHAQWLVTRDRALLRLAKAARRHGVSIVRPASWRSGTAPNPTG